MMFRKIVVCLSIVSVLSTVSGGAIASGFALLEQNASGMGNAYAGAAAVAEDASTIYFNPAGLSRLSGKQVVVAAHAIRPSVKFSGTGLAGTDMGGDAGSLAYVPNGYFAMEVNQDVRVGLGVYVPFGLQTEYTSTWVGRAHAIKSKIETINLNPSLSYRLNDSISLGAGLNYQRIRGILTSNVDPTPSISTLSGSDGAWGYNLGALISVVPQTRIGLAYRSGIKYDIRGQASLTAPLAALSGPASLSLKMPASFSAGMFHQIDNEWDVMADAAWTGWGTFKELRVLDAAGAVIQLVPENWRDTWRLAAGGNFHHNGQWTSRIGVSYEQTPVPDAFRTARIPDENSRGIAFGVQYRPDRYSSFDLGYTHLFMNNASINSTAATSVAATPALVGTYRNSADILSVQYTYSF